MAHIHSVYDNDTHFKINPYTRVIENTSEKVIIMQNDHNSERFTFEIPRYIDGHDMSLCNKVQVHFNNIKADKTETTKDVYTVEDLQISPDSEDVVICSWLISQNATKYAGALNFVLRYACLTDTVIDYQWYTDIHKGIAVSESISNNETAATEYFDILEQWKKELEEEFREEFSGGGTGGTGADGYSPSATVTQTSTGATITITDKSGTTTATITNGKDGSAGKDGAAGAAGKDGSNGKDGVSCTHSWSGTTLSVTSASGTSSANLKGDKGDTGSAGANGKDGAAGKDGVGIKSVVQTTTSSADGGSNVITVTLTNNSTSTFTVKNGSKGSAGASGKTPVKGTDYWTDADKEEIIAAVVAELAGSSVIGVVDENNVITVTSSLAAGTYTLKYENSDGSVTEVGNITITDSGEPIVSYTNLADASSADWLTNKRINSSKNVVDVTESQRGDDTVVVTNFIDIVGVQKLHIKGLDVLSALSSGQNYGRFYVYDSNKTIIVASAQPSSTTYVTVADYDSSVWIIDCAAYLGEWGYSDERYVRLGGILTGTAADVIITADENIR